MKDETVCADCAPDDLFGSMHTTLHFPIIHIEVRAINYE